ncbi:MAG: recombination mediator RecR [Verrucomicrobiota bacterium]
MVSYPPCLQDLIDALRALPSVGPRSAERLALFIIKNEKRLGQNIAETITQAQNKIHPCPQCGFFTQEANCEICADEKRLKHVVCIVENATDVLAFERTENFNGVYRVLGGTLSPLDGIGPEELEIPRHLREIEEQKVKEVIIGLSADVRGETTALYLADHLKKIDIKVTRLATGLSVGGSLEFADAMTLTHALQDRKEI